MPNNKDWVSVNNSPSIRKGDRAAERKGDPQRQRNYGPIREDSGLPPRVRKTWVRRAKDTLRRLVGSTTKEEERRKTRQK